MQMIITKNNELVKNYFLKIIICKRKRKRKRKRKILYNHVKIIRFDLI